MKLKLTKNSKHSRYLDAEMDGEKLTIVISYLGESSAIRGALLDGKIVPAILKKFTSKNQKQY